MASKLTLERLPILIEYQEAGFVQMGKVASFIAVGRELSKGGYKHVKVLRIG